MVHSLKLLSRFDLITWILC